jgi:hypothetical protein
MWWLLGTLATVIIVFTSGNIIAALFYKSTEQTAFTLVNLLDSGLFYILLAILLAIFW